MRQQISGTLDLERSKDLQMDLLMAQDQKLQSDQGGIGGRPLGSQVKIPHLLTITGPQ